MRPCRPMLPLLAALMVGGCGWLPRSTRTPAPPPPPVRDTVPPPPDLSLPGAVALATDSAMLDGLRRLALRYDSVQHYGVDPRWQGAPLLASLAQMIAQLGQATTTEGRAAVLASTAWGGVGRRTLDGPPAAPTLPTIPAAWQRPRYPSAPVRAASLIALWSTLRHQWAHRALADEDLDAAFARVLPAVLAATDSLVYVTALRDFLAATADSRVQLDDPTLSARLGGGALPLDVRPVEGVMTITRLHEGATASGLAVGDVIERIDDDPIERKLDAVERLLAASNVWSRQRDAYQWFLRGPIGSQATVQVRRLGARGRSETRTATLTRVALEARVPDQPSVAVTVIGTGVVRLDVTRLTLARIDSLRAAPPAALVIDLRHGPPSDAFESLLRWLADAGPVRTALLRRTLVPCAGCEERLTHEWSTSVTGTAPGRFGGRVVVLIDDRVEDASEAAALALIAVGATPIGTATAGAGGPRTSLALPGGYVVHFPWAEVRWPDGRPLQRVGITPLLEARATVAGVRDGRDEPVDVALRYLLPPATNGRRR